MSARRREPKPGEWSYTVENLTAYERTDRGFAIYTRVWNGKAYTGKKFLCAPIRVDERIVPELETAAQEAAIERQKAIATGAEFVEGGPLTLGAGFRKMLHDEEGKYPGDNEWRREVTRYLEIVGEHLDPAMLWSDLKHSHYRSLWRWLARENRESGRFGVRAAEMIVGALQGCARWLQQEEHIETSALPAPGWKAAMRAEWAEITGRPLKDPALPRYTKPEQAKLWAALPTADPRIQLATEIGAELRLGQVARSKRTDIREHQDQPIGAVQVHGRGKKLGVVVILTDRERAVLTEALETGYLSVLEAAYRSGEIEDYYLITGGHLAKGKAQLMHADRPWGKTGMVKKWKALEKLAGVEHVKGRNWYGLRRRGADDADDATTDASTKNKLGGWSNTTTREHYQEKGRTEIAERARDVREKIRPGTELVRE